MTGGFHGNVPWWPSNIRARADVVEGNSLVPVGTWGAANPAVAASAASYALAIVPQAHVLQHELASGFHDLAERWREETEFSSSVTALFMHPAYQEIIGLGRDVLPFIIQDLAVTGSNWFWALRAISGENPVPPEERGQVDRMTARWLEWGHMHGYL